MNVISVQYECAVPANSVGIVSTIGNTFPLVKYNFASADDYAKFNQASVEVSLANMLTAFCTSFAEMLGATLEEVQAGIDITRIWIFAGPDFLTNQVTFTDEMTYP